jgi:hypothetical protein
VSIISDIVKGALGSMDDRPKDRPATIIMTPVMNALVDILYINSLLPTLQNQYADAQHFMAGNSNISHARNMMLNLFWNLPQFDRVVLIDADIAWSPQDWQYLMEGPEEVVVAEYAKKVQGTMPDGSPWTPVKGGMGFVRVERSAFQKLVDATTEQGTDRIPRYYENGQLCYDFCYTGASGDGRFITEDRGFFMYCMLAGITVRNETRTRLKHVGRAVFDYEPLQATGNLFGPFDVSSSS